MNKEISFNSFVSLMVIMMAVNPSMATMDCPALDPVGPSTSQVDGVISIPAQRLVQFLGYQHGDTNSKEQETARMGLHETSHAVIAGFTAKFMLPAHSSEHMLEALKQAVQSEIHRTSITLKNSTQDLAQEADGTPSDNSQAGYALKDLHKDSEEKTCKLEYIRPESLEQENNQHIQCAMDRAQGECLEFIDSVAKHSDQEEVNLDNLWTLGTQNLQRINATDGTTQISGMQWTLSFENIRFHPENDLFRVEAVVKHYVEKGINSGSVAPRSFKRNGVLLGALFSDDMTKIQATLTDTAQRLTLAENPAPQPALPLPLPELEVIEQMPPSARQLFGQAFKKLAEEGVERVRPYMQALTNGEPTGEETSRSAAALNLVGRTAQTTVETAVSFVPTAVRNKISGSNWARGFFCRGTDQETPAAGSSGGTPDETCTLGNKRDIEAGHTSPRSTAAPKEGEEPAEYGLGLLRHSG